MATIQDIANIIGCSKSTVSRALNNNTRISEKKRNEIQNLAKELNFTPNQSAVGLAKNKTNVIGIEIPATEDAVSDPFFLEFIGAINKITREKGYSLLLTDKVHNNEKLKNWDSELKKVDGMILTDPLVNDNRIEYLNKLKKPYVFLGRPFENDEESIWVDCDNIEGAYTATKYLLEKGHRKILFIAGKKELVSSYKRLNGYMKAMNEYKDSKKIIIAGNYTQDGGYQAMKTAIKNEEFTAVFSGNDLMALGAMKAIIEMNYKIKKDYSIIGFDGIKLSELVIPGLTTMKQPIYELGKIAAQKLLEQIEGKGILQKHYVLPIELIERDSV